MLAGSKASSCSNERSHSVSWRILLPNSIEQLTLDYHYIRREVIAVLKKLGASAEAVLAVLDLGDLEEARLEVVEEW